MFSLGQDNAFGQPLESQLRSTLLAVWLAEAIGVDTGVRATAYWAGQLRYIGCTGHAHEVAAMFGDEIETRARTLRYDAANPTDVLRDVLAHGLPDRRGLHRIGAVASILAGGRRFAQLNFRTGCEVGDAIAASLGMTTPVREALACSFERWNGKGQPNQVSGEQIPLPMRIVHLTHDAEALDRLASRDDAIRIVGERSGRAYDPALVSEFTKIADELFGRLEKADPWHAVIAAEPAPRQELDGAALDRALTVAADFIDLKSPYTAGHSRQVAELTATACEHAGLRPAEVAAARRAALVHDFGRTAIPNSIWDKPGPLTRAEFDRVQLHPLLTEQMLRRSPGLRQLASVAACHHEKADGTGYPQGLTVAQMTLPARILGAADRYSAMTQPRAHRPALTPAAAAAELRRMADDGQVDPRAAAHVLAAAGAAGARMPGPAAGARMPGPAASPPALPAGLTAREAEVLRLAALGLTTRAIAERLVISPKTADSHIQHAYIKIGVSTRGAAALFAMRNGLVG
jgi:HD-GYP domain-containing protein (c-di-GMP phosphodiesterase class II)/DNA-binding CsgD family transcriptional regulator